MLQRNIRRLFHFKYSFSILKDWQWNMILCFNVNDNLEAMGFWNETGALYFFEAFLWFVHYFKDRKAPFRVSFWALVVAFCHVSKRAFFQKESSCSIFQKIANLMKNQAFRNPKRRFRKAPFSSERVWIARHMYWSYHICIG